MSKEAAIRCFEGQSVLVTGGLGFVGRHVVQGLLDYGVAEVDIVDDCSNSSPVMPEEWGERVIHHQVSVLEDGWLGLMNRQRAVFHLACKTLLECDDDPVLDNAVNAGSTLRMLQHIRDIRGSKDRPSFVYASSACVYGATPADPITEDYALNPTSPYGISKLAGEKYALLYASRYGIDACAIRISNAYGPGQTPDNPYCGVIGRFMRWAAEGSELQIVGDGGQSRDFTFVRDTAEALIHAAASSETQSQVFNAATGNRTTVNEVAAGVRELFPEVGVRSVPLRPIDDIRHRTLNSLRLRDTTGWMAQTALTQGLRFTKDWQDRVGQVA